MHTPDLFAHACAQIVHPRCHWSLMLLIYGGSAAVVLYFLIP